MTYREELLYRAERLRQSAELAKAACLDALVKTNGGEK